MKKLRRLKLIFQYINNHPLAGKHRLKAYGKFLQWQFIQFIIPGERKVRFLGNTFLLVKKGMAGATGNIYTGLHEFTDMGFLVHLLRKDDLFADIGANIGSFTVLASGYSGAKSISFEPVPATFQQLQKNVAINHIEKLVRIYNIGIGSEKATLMFTSSYDSVNHVVPASEKNYGGNAIRVDVLPLDEVLQEGEIPMLVKIDVEGYETAVLKGMAKTLADHRLKAIIIELYGAGERYGFDDMALHQNLLDLGFQTCLYDPFLREITLVKGFSAPHILYLRDIDFIRERLKNADKVNVFSETI